MSFKPYNQHQMELFPRSFDEFIPQNDPVRIISEIVDNLDIRRILSRYKKYGRSPYHPKMMIKVIIYAYMRNTYSSRKIEDFVRNDVRFIWLAGCQRPDHNTINVFRSGKLNGTIKEIFAQIVHFMVNQHMLTLERAYTDGTKIEANANKYSFVWGKAIHTSTERIARQLNELWDYAQVVTKDELLDKTPITYQDITADKIDGLISQIDQALSGVDVDKKVKAKITRIKKAWPSQIENYEKINQELGGRNSMSKTDKDASFMRMKEDHMLNGQLKPGYNTQISTDQGFVSNYTIHQSATDTGTYIEHMDEFKNLHNHYPKESICDAGYGSEENYTFTREKNITPYIKYNYFHKEQSKKWRNDPFLSSNFYYNQKKDCYYCPMGQPMNRISTVKNKTANGFIQELTLYKAIRCTDCPLRCKCHKSSGDRIIQVNHNLNQLRGQVRELLKSEQGVKHRKQRPADVEQTFGNIKHNKKFKRFYLRGLDKVNIEFGLVCISHNIAKYHAKMQKSA